LLYRQIGKYLAPLGDPLDSRPVMSVPPKMIRPRVGRITPATARANVVLPAPLAPTIAKAALDNMSGSRLCHCEIAGLKFQIDEDIVTSFLVNERRTLLQRVRH